MPPHIVRYPPIQCNTRERCDQLQIPAAPPAWRAPEGPDNLPAAPMGGGRAWPGFEGKLHHTQRRKRRRCGGRRRVQRARLRCPWAGGGAWPGFEATRRAKLAARRARGRAAAHGHTKQPGHAAGPDGAQNTSGATSNKTARPGCRRARLRHPWAAAEPGRASRGSSTTHSDTSAAGAEGAGGSRGPGCGARGRGGGAWPGFEATRRAKLAARTARGRAAAHGHTKQPGLARHTTQAPGPTAPRTPAVPQATKQQGLGAGGQGRASRSTTPSRRLACGDLAGGRTRRRPEHQRRHTQREPDTRKPRPADAGRGQPTQSGGKV